MYGVKGQVNNVPVNIWDRFYFYDNTSLKYEVPIDMNNKDITGVNKITTGDLNVNDQIDVKGNKIIGVGNGTANSDAVNKAQLDAVKTQVTQNKTDITTINTENGYYTFTDQLKHNNRNNVWFPPINRSLKHWRPSILYPFELISNNNTILRIKLDGWYQVIYTDNYRYGGQFQIYNNTDGVYLYTRNIPYVDNFTPLTISAVFEIVINKNLVNYIDISLLISNIANNKNNPRFEGINCSSFYMKYLGVQIV